MEEKKFDPGEKIFVNFRDFMIQGTRETEYDGQSIVHTYVSMPGTSAYKGFQLDYTNLVWDQQLPTEDGGRKTAEGWKTIRLYENAEYTLRKTPKKEDGTYDYENQETVKIRGTDLQREMNSWRKEPSLGVQAEQSFHEESELVPEFE